MIQAIPMPTQTDPIYEAGKLERIASLTSTLRVFYRCEYDGPDTESAGILEMREELGRLLAPGERLYDRERAFHAVMGWRFP